MHDVQLKSFLVAADSGSFAKAAKELYVSAPAFIHRINTLERELGFTLFERTSKGAVLTDPGKDFYESVQAALRTLESSKARCLGKIAEEKKAVRIACPSLNGLPDFFLPFTSWFEQRHPDIKLLFISTSWPTMIMDLSNDLFDVCFSLPFEGYESKGLVWKELYRDRYYLVCPPSDKLASYDSVALDKLAGRKVFCDSMNFLVPELASLYEAAETNGAVLSVAEAFFSPDGVSMLSAIMEGTLFFAPGQYQNAHSTLLSTHPLEWPEIYGGILYRENRNIQTECFIEGCESFFADRLYQ